MRKKTTILIALIALLAMLPSCAVYTIGQGKAAISVPEKVDEPETRIRVINERKDAAKKAEEERIAAIKAEAEAKRIAEEERIKAEEERKAAELAHYLATAVYEYPEKMEDLTLPWNYRPRRDHLELSTELSPLKVIFLPLSDGDNPHKIKTSIRDLEADFIVLTGTTRQLVNATEILGRDTVLFENAAVLYDTKVASYDDHSATFDIGGGKKIEVAVVNDFPSLPETSRDIKSWIEGMGSETKALDEVELEENSVIFALSSIMPGGDDWQTFSPYPYRTDMSFSTPGWFTRNGFRDVWAETHFSSETAPGITRENGEIFERLDFIYTKDLAPLESVTFSVAGMANRAIYAEVLVP